MRLSKMILPGGINAAGEFCKVKTGHPYWFRFAELLKKGERRLSAYDFLYDGEPPADRGKGFEELFKFFSPERILPRADRGDDGGETALDYEIDAELIYAAFLEQYGVDLFDKEIHWHKVLAMIAGLHSTKLNDIIGYRLYKKPAKGDSYDKDMMRLKHLWRIETDEDKEAAEREKDFFGKLKKPKMNT